MENSKRVGFFEQVYQLVRQIPTGRVASYGTIARMLGRPGAARIVGWALHSIPEQSDVPWHRVLNRRGQIAFNPQSNTANLQRALLEAEGIEFDAHGCVDWERFAWPSWDDSIDVLRNSEKPHFGHG
ncbi:MAG TPA: MGMT family protein [Chloroflexi bacterium]|nr:MGMT family protein [Chloroflexota bacterium]